MKYPNLFEKGRIGKVELKNRIVMAPMGDGLIGFMGTFSDRAIDYYERRAIGGTGLIITSLCLVNSKIEPWEIDGEPCLTTFDNALKVRNFLKLTERVHDYGAKIFAQLTGGFGRVYPTILLQLIEGAQPIAPSPTPLYWDPKTTARALSRKEIDELIASFGKAAGMAKTSGFDGVELHAHEGYLIDQFTSALWNKREDEFGGDLVGRMRFPLAIIKQIQRSVGEDFPIVYRYGGDQKISGGRQIEESIQMAGMLEDAGVAALHVDAGCYDSWHWPHPPEYQPPGCMVDMAEAVKAHVKIPVIAVGRLGYPKLANQVLADNRADFVALGRPLLADPDFAEKARQGLDHEICPCIGCHECLARIVRMQSVSCAVNPQCGDEKRLTIAKAPTSKRVTVVGGGVAGMEAARVAALRGHRVTLFEKDQHLGGVLRVAGIPEFKADLLLLVDYMTAQLKKLENVEIRLGAEADEATIKAQEPDVLFLATGAVFRKLEDEAVDLAPDVRCLSPQDAYENKIPDGSQVLIVGGGSVGSEVGLYLAQKGCAVTIVEMLPDVASDLFEANQHMLKELLSEHGVEIFTRTKVTRISPKSVSVSTEAGPRELQAEVIVSALGSKPVDSLHEKARALADEVHVIGDCRSARRVKEAIWEAFKTARIV